MSQREILYQWSEEIGQHMPGVSKPQLFMMAAFSLGLALSRRCTLSVVGESLWGLGKPDTVERRLQRFLSNSKVAWSKCSEALAHWVMSSMVSTADPIVLLVDETSLQDKLKVMAVSVAYRGRAIPVTWWCYRQEQWPMSQVKLITTLLERVRSGIPEGTTVLVEADRGIGNSPQLWRAIEKMGWYYWVRVTGHVRVCLEDGSEVTFRSLSPKPASRWHGKVRAFKKAGWLTCWAEARWDKGKEPWLLLTNYPAAQGDWYALRMWEEVAFKDFKSSGWQWQRSHVWDPEHANRLWLVMALAYVWAISIGTRVADTPELRSQMTRGKRTRLSVFQLGLRLLKRYTQLGLALFYKLLLIPHLPLHQKTVV